jgi:hypothetical protein
MGSIPHGLRCVFSVWSDGFADSVWPRFLTLLCASILCAGRHTVSRVLRVAGSLAVGHPSTYHRVLSKRRWSSWRLARHLAGHILLRFLPEGSVPLVGDDTVTEHRGKNVFGKGCHRDAVRSTHSHLAYRWGHKWVVLAILVRLPGTHRAWALPILCALYRTKEENQRLGKRHKTPVDLMRQLLCVLLRWFPQRKFVFSGDGGFGTHALTRFAHRHLRQLTLVSRFYPDANLYAAPPVRKAGTNGRPRLKGKKLPSPAKVVERTRRPTRLDVGWYGGGRRRIEVVSGTAHWYRMGEGLVPILWVFVRDRTGTHRDDYFFTTDLTLTPKQIVEYFTGRWAIEVTFEEAREYVGFETTRGWCRRTVLRAEPCLLGLYTMIALWYAELPQRACTGPPRTWVGKRAYTFSDAIQMVRRQLWQNWVFQSPRHRATFAKLTTRERSTILSALTLAS